MSHDGSTASVASTAHGFWIFCAVVGFTVGYPLLVFAALEPHRLLVTTALVFGTAAFFTASGFGWARIIHIVLSLGVVMYLLVRLLSTLQFGIVGTWSITMLVLVVPLVGYTAAAGLLCSTALKNWQAGARAMRSTSTDVLETEVRNADLEVCPWCDAVAVDACQNRCLACNRPA